MHEQSNRPRHWRRLALASTFVGIALVGGLASATPAAAVAPHTPSTTVRTADAIVPDNAGPRCGTGNSDGNVSTCITAYGSGLHVININVSAVVLNSTRTISVCLAGPNGSLGCTPPPGQGSITLSPGGFIAFSWGPNASEPAGDYCANTWRNNGDGTTTQIGHECIGVSA